MDLTYPIKHWIFTLVSSPLLAYLYQLLSAGSGGYVADLLDVYPFTLLFSILLSLPTFIIYLIAYDLLMKGKVDDRIIKLTLIVTAVAGIIITIQITLPNISLWNSFKIIYSISAVIGGLLFEITSQSGIKR